MTTLAIWTITAVAAVYVVMFTPPTLAKELQISELRIVISEQDKEGQRFRANAKVDVEHQSQYTVECDAVSDDDGLIRCGISCDPEYNKFTTTFKVVFQCSGTHRAPGNKVVKLKNCTIEPQQIEATYVHWRHVVKSTESQFSSIIDNSEPLRLAYENISDRKAVTESLSQLALDKSGAEQLHAFAMKSADLSEIYKRLEKQDEAATFERYKISAVQALLSAHANVLGIQKSFPITGNQQDYLAYLETFESWFAFPYDNRVISHPKFVQDFRKLRNEPLNQEGIDSIYVAYLKVKRKYKHT